MNYTLHQLLVFHKVCELQSITKAADELNLTQPAVSIQLKNFQDQFPIPLTEVVGRKLYITDFGWEIAAASEKILAELEAINYRTLAFQGKLAGRLRFSVVSTGKYVIPFFVSNFISEHSGIELQIDVTNKTRVEESLELNRIDFALVSDIPKKLRINKLLLMENRLFYVISPKYKLPSIVTTQTLFEDVPIIFRESGSSTRGLMEEFILDKGFRVYQNLELTSNEAVKQAVIAGLGASILPLIGIKNELANGSLKIVHVLGLPIKTTWNLIWMESKKLSPSALAFLHYLEVHKEEIMNQHFKWKSEY